MLWSTLRRVPARAAEILAQAFSRVKFWGRWSFPVVSQVVLSNGSPGSLNWSYPHPRAAVAPHSRHCSLGKVVALCKQSSSLAARHLERRAQRVLVCMSVLSVKGSLPQKDRTKTSPFLGKSALNHEALVCPLALVLHPVSLEK